MFSIGDKIAHPLHGAGVIDSIEERKIDGVIRSYYLMRMRGGMTVLIPTDNCEASGVRHVVEAREAELVFDEIPKLDIEMTTNWNRRYRENMIRIKSGDLIEVAKVCKGLKARDSERGLSTSERKMLNSAKQILISEIVLSQEKSYEEVELRLEASFA